MKRNWIWLKIILFIDLLTKLKNTILIYLINPFRNIILIVHYYGGYYIGGGTIPGAICYMLGCPIPFGIYINPGVGIGAYPTLVIGWALPGPGYDYSIFLA